MLATPQCGMKSNEICCKPPGARVLGSWGEPRQCARGDTGAETRVRLITGAARLDVSGRLLSLRVAVAVPRLVNAGFQKHGVVHT